MSATKLWISLLEIIPLPGNPMLLTEAAGAYVNAVAYAENETELCEKLRRTVAAYNAELRSIESIAVIEGDPLQQAYEPAVIEAITELSPKEDARFGTVHCYPAE